MNAIRDVIKAARPRQWTKGAFVLVGPLYGMAAGKSADWDSVLLALVAFSAVSSAGYIINDLHDREADRHHPRKSKRPIASGRVSPRAAWTLVALLFAVGLGSIAGVIFTGSGSSAQWLGACVIAYGINVVLYSMRLKRAVMADVISLALGFVLRVLGGCAAAAIEPSTWLLNSVLFLSMFLAFAKRFGERRTMEHVAHEAGDDAAAKSLAEAVRPVQGAYTNTLLRMAVVVTAVACLLTYAGYVQFQDPRYTVLFHGLAVVKAGSVQAAGAWGFNVLWLTMLPATYALLRSIVLVEQGRYDDPTELATRDWPTQIAGAAFVLFTGLALALSKLGAP
ncbi:MAG: UbiA prenyltransferase family protein [Planctomycetota bacterium]|nr:UbiA prenyltransferase family protein [Planctomycetota bacterium]